MPKQKHEMCAYEMLRQRNLEDNKAVLAKLMADLEQFDVVKKITPKPKKPREPRRASDTAAMKENRRENPRRSARFTPYDPPVTRARRRGSLASSTCSSANTSPLKENNALVVKFGGFFKPKNRNTDDGDDDMWDEDEAKLKRKVTRFQCREVKAFDEITDDDIDLVADSVRDKEYDSIYGSTCHQCRQKTDDQKTICRAEECMGVRGQFCGPCLRNRYGEDAKEALRNPKWECPPCRGICNCSFCRARTGKRATGILIHLARDKGFSNVAEYLQSLM